MTSKKITFPYEMFENFVQLVSQDSGKQNEWWKQLGINSQNLKDLNSIQKQIQEFVNGVNIYKQTDFRREIKEPPVIWAMGSAKLYDYSETTDTKTPVLFIIPSLINRAYVLDLTEKTSFLRLLAKSGVRPFLLDWGILTEAERSFSLEDYINEYLLPAYDHVGKYTKRPLNIMGYCMGGMLAMATTVFRPQTQKLILLASPWDFHSGHEWLVPWINASSFYLENIIDTSSELPVEMIQYMFAILNPLGVMRKFQDLPQIANNIDKLQDFVSVEDWLNDCVPLAPKVAKEILFDWYRDNKPVKSEWTINKKKIKPEQIKQAALIISPQRDKIISPKSCEALTKSLPDQHMIQPDTGHIGVVIGKNTETQVVQPIIDFIKKE